MAEVESLEPRQDAPARESSSNYSSTGNEKAAESTDQALDQPSHNHPHGFKLALIITSLCMTVFLCGLDQTILATAVPKISNDFHALNDIGWWTAAYLLTTSIFQLTYGKVYSLFSVKWVYLIAIFFFELGSLVCTVAPNSVALIAGRAVAGVGAAGMFSGPVIILADAVPLEKRPMYTGLVTGMFGVASIVGPFIGGVLTDESTWRWCFGINLPLGVFTMGVIVIFVRDPPGDPRLKSLPLTEKIILCDLPGNFTIIPSLLCLLLALQWGGQKYAWDSGRIIALLVLFGVLLIAFIVIEIFTPKTRMVPSRVLRNRSIKFSALFASCSSGGMFVAVTYLPLWFQAVKHKSALDSGLMIMPLMLGFVICSVIAGILTTVVGYYTPSMIACAVLTSIGAGFLTTFDANKTHSPQWIGFQAMYGMGVGLGMQQPFLVVQTVLPESDIPLGAGLVNLCQIMSGSIFVPIAQAVFQNGLSSKIAALFPGFDIDSLFSAGATNMRNLFTPDELPSAISAYGASITLTFYITVALSAVSVIGALGTEFKSVKKVQQATVADP